ncbi:MAG: twin-arginine translocase TatA/TatE family subunit [Deltaproteobacteria bacterium]
MTLRLCSAGIEAMFGLGVPELIVILVVVLLIFGPKKLPELGSFIGRSLKDFREALDQRDHEADEKQSPPEPPPEVIVTAETTVPPPEPTTTEAPPAATDDKTKTSS